MTLQSFALSPRARQAVVRGAGHTGRMGQPRAAAWRPRKGNPSGLVRLPTCLRHFSVVDGRPLPRFFLACAQTASGANRRKAMGRL